MRPLSPRVWRAGARATTGVMLATAVSSCLLARDASAKASTDVAPSPLFAAYRSLCLEAAGDQAKSLAKAQSAGWIQTPSGDLLPLGLLSMADAQQRESVRGGLRLRLVTGHARDPAGLGLTAKPWAVCLVSGDPPDAAAAGALGAWAGVAPANAADPADPGSVLFAIADPQTPSRRSAAGLSDAELQGLADQGRLAAAGVRTAGPLTLLLYAASRP